MHTPRQNVASPHNSSNNTMTPRSSFRQQSGVGVGGGSLTGTPNSHLFRTSNVASALANNMGVASPLGSPSQRQRNSGALVAPGSPASVYATMMQSPIQQPRQQQPQQQQYHQRINSASSNNNNNNNGNTNELVLSGSANNVHLYDRFISNIGSPNFRLPHTHHPGSSNTRQSPSNNSLAQEQARFNLFAGAPRTYQRGMTRSRSPEDDEKSDEPYARLLQQSLLTPASVGASNTIGNDDDDDDDDGDENDNDNTDGGVEEHHDNNESEFDTSAREDYQVNNDSRGEYDVVGGTPVRNAVAGGGTREGRGGRRLSHQQILLGSPAFDLENSTPTQRRGGHAPSSNDVTKTNNIFNSNFFNNHHNAGPLYQVGAAVVRQQASDDAATSPPSSSSSAPLQRRSIIFPNNVPSSRLSTTLTMSPASPVHSPQHQQQHQQQQQHGSSSSSATSYPPLFSGRTSFQHRPSVRSDLSQQQDLLSPTSSSTNKNNSNNNNNDNSNNQNQRNPDTTASAAAAADRRQPRRNSHFYSGAVVDDDDETARDSAASSLGVFATHNGGRLSSNIHNTRSNNSAYYYLDDGAPSSSIVGDGGGGGAGAGAGVGGGGGGEGERFSWTLSSVYNANKARNFKSRAFRVIPQTPERILDAPDLLDDFYLHLLDWGSRNILAVALSHTLYLWNAESGEITQLMTTQKEDPASSPQQNVNQQRDEYITGLSWHPDGNYLSVGLSSSDVQLWDTSAQKLVRTYTGHSGRVGSLAWSHGGVLASGGRDATIRLHDIRVSNSGVFGLLKGHTQEVCGLSWSPCGRRLASGGNDNLVNIWDFPARYSNSGGLNSMTGLGGSTAATSRGTSPNGTSSADDGSSSFGVFSASSAIEDGRPLMQLRRHVAAVKGLAWNPVRRGLLATGGGTADKTLCFWDINAPVSTAVATPISLLNSSSAHHLNNHPQNNLAHIHPSLAGSNPSAIQAHFSVVQTNPLHSVDTQSQICGVLWNRDGTEVVTSHGYSDHQLSLWKYPSLRRIADLTGHGARVLHLSMSPDGEVVVSAAADETIRFWRCFAKSTSPSARHRRSGAERENDPPPPSVTTASSSTRESGTGAEGGGGDDDGQVPLPPAAQQTHQRGNVKSPASASSANAVGGGSTRKSQHSRLNADDVDYDADWDLNLR